MAGLHPFKLNHPILNILELIGLLHGFRENLMHFISMNESIRKSSDACAFVMIIYKIMNEKNLL